MTNCLCKTHTPTVRPVLATNVVTGQKFWLPTTLVEKIVRVVKENQDDLPDQRS